MEDNDRNKIYQALCNNAKDEQQAHDIFQKLDDYAKDRYGSEDGIIMLDLMLENIYGMKINRKLSKEELLVVCAAGYDLIGDGKELRELMGVSE